MTSSNPGLILGGPNAAPARSDGSISAPLPRFPSPPAGVGLGLSDKVSAEGTQSARGWSTALASSHVLGVRNSPNKPISRGSSASPFSIGASSVSARPAPTTAGTSPADSRRLGWQGSSSVSPRFLGRAARGDSRSISPLAPIGRTRSVPGSAAGSSLGLVAPQKPAPIHRSVSSSGPFTSYFSSPGGPAANMVPSRAQSAQLFAPNPVTPPIGQGGVLTGQGQAQAARAQAGSRLRIHSVTPPAGLFDDRGTADGARLVGQLKRYAEGSGGDGGSVMRKRSPQPGDSPGSHASLGSGYGNGSRSPPQYRGGRPNSAQIASIQSLMSGMSVSGPSRAAQQRVTAPQHGAAYGAGAGGQQTAPVTQVFYAAGAAPMYAAVGGASRSTFALRGGYSVGGGGGGAHQGPVNMQRHMPVGTSHGMGYGSAAPAGFAPQMDGFSRGPAVQSSNGAAYGAIPYRDASMYRGGFGGQIMDRVGLGYDGGPVFNQQYEGYHGDYWSGGRGGGDGRWRGDRGSRRGHQGGDSRDFRRGHYTGRSQHNGSHRGYRRRGGGAGGGGSGRRVYSRESRRGRAEAKRGMRMGSSTGGLHSGESLDSIGPECELHARWVEAFGTSKTAGVTLEDVARREMTVDLAMDQYGSRFLQQRLEVATPAQKEASFKAIYPAALRLCTDVFGNYVVQKLFEHGSDAQRAALAATLKGKVLSLSMQMYGCRVVQKAIDVLGLEQKSELVRELHGHVMRCVRDQNGNHVIQKCIEKVPPSHIEFIVEAFEEQHMKLATHPYGCRVIQRLLEHCSSAQRDAILKEILEATVMLAKNQYGNYVVQHVLIHGSAEHRAAVIRSLHGSFLPLSKHKFASNVIEKCVTHATRQERQALIEEFLGTNASALDSNPPLMSMIRDQYANYVVQKLIDVMDPEQRQFFVQSVVKHLPSLRKIPYGKHIVSRIEKIAGCGF